MKNRRRIIFTGLGYRLWYLSDQIKTDTSSWIQILLVGSRYFWLGPDTSGWIQMLLVESRYFWLDSDTSGWIQILLVESRYFWLDPDTSGWIQILLVGFRYFWLDPDTSGWIQILLVGSRYFQINSEQKILFFLYHTPILPWDNFNSESKKSKFYSSWINVQKMCRIMCRMQNGLNRIFLN